MASESVGEDTGDRINKLRDFQRDGPLVAGRSAYYLTRDGYNRVTRRTSQLR